MSYDAEAEALAFAASCRGYATGIADFGAQLALVSLLRRAHEAGRVAGLREAADVCRGLFGTDEPEHEFAAHRCADEIEALSEKGGADE